MRNKIRKKRELNSVELNVATAERPRKTTINLDTGAAATIVPAKMLVGTPDGRSISFKTAFGQTLKDEGYVELNGEDELYNKKMLKGRVTQAQINGDGGFIIPNRGRAEELAGRNSRFLKQRISHKRRFSVRPVSPQWRKTTVATDLEAGWDLTDKIDVLALKHRVKLDDPMLLTGSPAVISLVLFRT